MNSKRKYIEDNIDFILKCNEERLPLVEVSRRLKVKYLTSRKYIKLLNIPYTNNPNRKGLPHTDGRKSIEEILQGNSSNTFKRIALIREGIKEEVCECCKLSEWMGKPIPLELHHKDFNHYNNSLDNLQILCANCHMQAHNYNNNS